MLLADTDPTVIAFFGALIPLVVILTTILQSWHQRQVAKTKEEKDKKAAEEKDAADKAALEATARTLAAKTDQTAKAVSEKLDKALNGEGIGGKLDEAVKKIDALAAWQIAHDAQDNQRHDEMLGRILGLKVRPPEAKP